MFVVFGAVSLTRLNYLLKSLVFDVAVYAVGVIGVTLLVSRQREQRYSRRYEHMPLSTRRAFALSVLAIFLAGLIAFLSPAAKHSGSAKHLSCAASAEETTADCF
jgi:hypothetical protein